MADTPRSPPPCPTAGTADTLPHSPPTPAYNPYQLFPAADDVFPFLAEIKSHWRGIREEMVSAGTWTHWPEFGLYHPEQGEEWRVAPLLYTIPSDDPTQSTWVPSTRAQCPLTASLLSRIPGIRTALFSRLGPRTTLAPHQGWASLANHVLRCHLALVVPGGDEERGGPPVSGVVVENNICPHVEGQILVFDDSRVHSAFNHSNTESRVVLIFDVVRPARALPGSATGGETPELRSLIEYFT